MCAELRKLTWALMLLFLSGALCRTWKVEYHHEHICAVKGSSVVIPCMFDYPDNHIVRVVSVMWGHERYNIFAGPFLFNSNVTNTSSKFEYIGDKEHNCSLKIHQVEHNDTGKHTFRFITNFTCGQWTGREGSTLKVVDLNISVSELNGNRTTREGDSVNLTCTNGCDGGQLSSAFTWFQNGEPINEGPVLYLSNMSSTNSGNYTCSLKTHTGTTSTVINIDVEYGPKNTSVSVRPSTEVDAGSNMTLICSSHANPPVDSYTWFKIDDDDDDGIIDVGYQPVLLSDDGGQYFCRATNKHGSQNSSVVTLKIKTLQTSTDTSNRYALIISTVAGLLIVISVVAIRRLKKRTRAPENDCEEDIQSTDYVNWPVFENNQSEEGDRCDGATAELIYTTVDFHTERKSNMEQQMDPHNDDQSVIYSTVCREQQVDSHNDDGGVIYSTVCRTQTKQAKSLIHRAALI